MSKMRRQAGTVGLWTMASRILGLVREMLQARLIGAGMEQSAFAFAFCVPNLARRLFGEGALTSAFVPVFKAEAEAGRKAQAEALARAVCSMVMLMLFAASVLGIALLQGFETVARPAEGSRLSLILSLTKIMLPYAVLICGAAFGMGVLNSLKRFAAPAFVPCILNFVWIGVLLGLWFIPGLMGMGKTTRVEILSVAVLLAGALQLAFMLWQVRRAGYRLGLTGRGWKDEKTRRVWRNTFIAAIGAGALQINTLLDQLLAQGASEWAAGVIAYADRLMELPLAVIGTAFGTVLLPTFAGYFAKNDVEGARKAFVEAVRDLLLVMTPAAVGLAVLSADLTRAFFQGGAFDAVATRRVALAVACYAPAIVIFGYNKALTPWFHAQNDMKTPVRVALYLMGANLAMNVLAVLCLPVEWRHAGIASATGIGAFFTALWLTAEARRKNGSLGLGVLLLPGGKVLFASLMMGAVLLWIRPCCSRVIPGWFGDGFFGSMVLLGVLVFAGVLIYGVLMLLFFPGSRKLRSGLR